MAFSLVKFSKKVITSAVPPVRSLQKQRDKFAEVAAEQKASLQELRAILERREGELTETRGRLREINEFLDGVPSVIQYRLAHFEAREEVPSGAALPCARAWPRPDAGQGYKAKLIESLDMNGGKGVELGPLNLPIIPKGAANILYADHLDTDGLKKKYPTVADIAEVDRPIINNSLRDTLAEDAPIDYLVASQVFEHVANPIRWLEEIGSVLREGGLLSLALPDRRTTFDLVREETRASDIVSAFLEDDTIPSLRAAYDHHTQAAFINTPWAGPNWKSHKEVIAGRGAVRPEVVAKDPWEFIDKVKSGEYIDVHAWVFTPPSFLIAMAQLASEGLIRYRLRQFYPTNLDNQDRDAYAFIAVLEKVGGGVTNAELRASYLAPIGE